MFRVIKREMVDANLAVHWRDLRQCLCVLPEQQTLNAGIVLPMLKPLKSGGHPQRGLGGGDGFAATNSQMRRIMFIFERSGRGLRPRCKLKDGESPGISRDIYEK